MFPGSQWTDIGPGGPWRWYGAAMSPDGQIMVACVYGGAIYRSTDAGATWTICAGAGTRNWRNVAMSTDGQKIAACVFGGYIYTSTDGGATWTASAAAGSRNWTVIACSPDGGILIAGAGAGYLYRSTNFGASWGAVISTARVWAGISCSGDGQKWVSAANTSSIYCSLDAGVTWTLTGPAKFWVDSKVSADGSTMLACDSQHLYSSTDDGATWTQNLASYSNGHRSVAVSADGSKIFMPNMNYASRLSVDGGETWTTLGVIKDAKIVATNSTFTVFLAPDDRYYGTGYLYRSVGDFMLRARHVAPSALRGAVSGRHVAQSIGYIVNIGAHHVAGWALLHPVGARQDVDWAIRPGLVSGRRSDQWALRRQLVARHADLWSPFALARARHVVRDAPLGRLATRHLSPAGQTQPLRARHQSLSGLTQPLGARHRAVSGVLAGCTVRHRATWRVTGIVAARHVAPSPLLAVTPVSAHHLAHAALSDTATRVVELPLQLIHAGRTLALGDPLELSCDDGASAWSATIQLDDPADFAPLRVGESVTLQIGPTRVALMIDALQHSRADSPTYQISALSPVARYGSPYAAPISLGPADMARTVCERLLGQAIDWQLPDWRLPEGASELEDTPLALARQIVAVVGGRLESRLDGSLRARPAAPVSPPQYATASAVRLGDDQLYAYSAQIDAPLIANRFVITSGDEAASDADQIQVEAIADASDPHAYTVRAYPTPWRPVELVHTGDSATTISARAEIQIDHDELIEIVAGAARTRYPVHAITTTRWQYADLGAVRLSDPQTLAAGGAESYSLLAIDYRARAWEWRVTNARTETIQFLATEP